MWDAAIKIFVRLSDIFNGLITSCEQSTDLYLPCRLPKELRNHWVLLDDQAAIFDN